MLNILYFFFDFHTIWWSDKSKDILISLIIGAEAHSVC